MSTPVLSEQDHEHFIEHGYVVVHNAVPPETIAAAVAVLENDGKKSGRAKEKLTACTTETLLDAIGELFGVGYPFLRQPSGYDMPRAYQPDDSWPTPIAHVDDCYPTMMPNGWALGSFVFLTPVRSHGGAFICFPGSYRRYRQAMAQSWHSIKEISPDPEYSGPFHEFLAAPGDVLLFHHILGHTGSTNTAGRATRHALLARWNPKRRIVPGDKPFDQMFTIEKVNSARYLAHRFDMDLRVRSSPTDEQSTAALAGGIVLSESIASYAILHFGGRCHLFFTEMSDPNLIRRQVSDDFINWRQTEPMKLSIGPIRALQFHQYGRNAILGVTTGGAQGRTFLFCSNDMDRWTELSAIDDCSTGTPWYVYPDYPSKVAGGQAVYFVPMSKPSQVCCSWGEEWTAAGKWKTRSVAVEAADDHYVQDVSVGVHHGDSGCTILVDLQPAGTGASESEPYYTQPRDVAVTEGSIQPLVYACATPPCRIRIFNRAPLYWMVTYLRRSQGQKRLFWGHIDWTEKMPTLRELSTIEAFDNAKAMVGFI